MSDDRDREIAALRAEVERLTNAVDATAQDKRRADGPLFGHGLRGGYFGSLELVIAMVALLILLAVFHRLTTPDPWRSHMERGGYYIQPADSRLPYAPTGN